MLKRQIKNQSRCRKQRVMNNVTYSIESTVKDNRFKMTWPEESETYWNEVETLAAVRDPSEHFKIDRVAERIPLYAGRMTSFDAVYLDDVIQYVNACAPTTRDTICSALRERKDGHTQESWEANVFSPTQHLRDVSVWTIKSFHHWLTFHQLSKRNINTYKRIVEVGAGIGESARVLFDVAGFKGEYTILDLPSIIKFSKKNLSTVALKDSVVKFCTELDDVGVADEDTLLFSTWGLSEIQLDYRYKILDRMKAADIFVAFQSIIFGINNNNFFLKEYPSKYRKNIRVRNIVNHTVDKGNFYMYGSKYE